MWSIKVYLILIEAITVVELPSRPCLDLAFTLPNPFLDLAMNLSYPCLKLALTLPWPCLEVELGKNLHLIYKNNHMFIAFINICLILHLNYCMNVYLDVHMNSYLIAHLSDQLKLYLSYKRSNRCTLIWFTIFSVGWWLAGWVLKLRIRLSQLSTKM